jgi:hypothetical protein
MKADAKDSKTAYQLSMSPQAAKNYLYLHHAANETEYDHHADQCYAGTRNLARQERVGSCGRDNARDSGDSDLVELASIGLRIRCWAS